MGKFKSGDKVKVNAGYSKYDGREGLIGKVVNEGSGAYGDGVYTVELFDDTIPERGFFENELDFADSTESGLTDLAEKLDAARLLANSIESAAPQGGVYGHVATGLWHTLYLILGSRDEAERAYEALLCGSSVREALKIVRGY